MKLKGIPSSVVESDLTFDHYKQCLYSQTETVSKMNLFRSKDHNVTTVHQSKISLSCFDDKRYIQPDGVSTLAHGHYSIE